MGFTAAEFIAFALAAQNREWETITGQPFSYEVQNKGIYLLPQSGKDRNISNAEIVRFCELFSELKSESTSDYQELFNKSYLLAIAKKYDPDAIQELLPEETATQELIKEGAAKKITVNT